MRRSARVATPEAKRPSWGDGVLAFMLLAGALFFASIPTVEPTASLAVKVIFVAIAGGLSSMAQAGLAQPLHTSWATWLSGMTGPVSTTLFAAWLLGSIATSGSTIPVVVVVVVAIGLVVSQAVVLPRLDRRWDRRSRREASVPH